MKTKARPELEALARHDYRRAIPLLQERAHARPKDLEAQLELALAHMLAGDEAQFAAIHQTVAARMPARPRRGRLAELWALSRGYFERLVQAASLVAALGATGCPEQRVDAGRAEPQPITVGPQDPGRPEPIAADPKEPGRPQPAYAVQPPNELPPGAYAEYAAPRPQRLDALRPVPDAGRPTPVIRPDNEPRNKYGVSRPKYAAIPVDDREGAPNPKPRRSPGSR